MGDIHSTINGNVTADPQERTHEGGGYTAIFRIAVNGRYFDPNKGQFEDRKTEFVTVFARRALGRHVVASVKKGEPLVVTGRLHTNEWTDTEGNTRFSLVMNAERVGHDLKFGTTSYTRPPRVSEEPTVDEYTGEVSPDESEGAETFTSGLASDAPSAPASLTAGEPSPVP